MEEMFNKAMELCDENYNLKLEIAQLKNICEILAERYLPGDDLDSFLLGIMRGSYNSLLKYLRGREKLN